MEQYPGRQQAFLSAFIGRPSLSIAEQRKRAGSPFRDVFQRLIFKFHIGNFTEERFIDIWKLPRDTLPLHMNFP